MEATVNNLGLGEMERKWKLLCYHGVIRRDFTPLVGNQIDKEIDSEMETGTVLGLCGMSVSSTNRTVSYLFPRS